MYNWATVLTECTGLPIVILWRRGGGATSRAHQVQHLPVQHVVRQHIFIANPRLNELLGVLAFKRCSDCTQADAPRHVGIDAQLHPRRQEVHCVWSSMLACTAANVYKRSALRASDGRYQAMLLQVQRTHREKHAVYVREGRSCASNRWGRRRGGCGSPAVFSGLAATASRTYVSGATNALRRLERANQQSSNARTSRG